jgi:hypothetical protein
MLFADSILQQSAGPIAILIVALLAWLGSRNGLFLATVWGLQALASVVAAFAITDHVDGLLMWAGMTNEFAMIWRQTIAFVTSVALVAIVIRLAVGGAIQEGATNYPPLVDLAGGGVVGALAGLVVAGTLQVILAMAPLPESMAFDHTKLGWDLGQGIIDLVGHCAPSMSSEERGIMMDGEPGFRPEKEDPAKAAPPPAPVDPSQPVLEKIELPQWSELYADVNWNQQWDEGEKYLDADDNGAFTWCLRSNDVNTNKTRDIGLRERYALGPWVTVRAVTKMDVQRLQRNGKLGPVEGLPYPPPGGLGPGVTPPAARPTVTDPAAGVPGQPIPGVVPPGTPAFPPQPPVAPGGTPPTQPVPSPQPGQPFPSVPQPAGQGTLPGVPKQPGQPAALTPTAPQQPGVPQPQPGVPQQPGVPAGQAPGPTPESTTPPPPTPPAEVPGRANEAPKPPPGPANPFKPAPKK